MDHGVPARIARGLTCQGFYTAAATAGVHGGAWLGLAPDDSPLLLRESGSDISLVGDAGSKGPAALRAKLARLSRETRGFRAEQDVPVEGRSLRVYPVEWAIARAKKQDPAEDRQRTLFD